MTVEPARWADCLRNTRGAVGIISENWFVCSEYMTEGGELHYCKEAGEQYASVNESEGSDKRLTIRRICIVPTAKESRRRTAEAKRITSTCNREHVRRQRAHSLRDNSRGRSGETGVVQGDGAKMRKKPKRGCGEA